MIDTSAEYGRLLALFMPIALAVIAIVFGLYLFTAIRFRSRGDDGPPGGGRTDAPRIEALYVVGLAVIAVVLVAATFRTEDRITRISSRPGLEVAATAAKWNWRFDYPAYGISQVGALQRPARLVVPRGTTVRFELTSVDVVHAFWVPLTRFKRDAFPGSVQRFDLVFDRLGRHRGVCAQFCGELHTDMVFEVEVMRPEAFAAWAQRRRGSAT